MVSKHTLTTFIGRATINLKPKIRTAEEKMISLPKKKTIVSLCTTNVRSYVCLVVSRKQVLQQCLIFDFLLGIVTENVFLLAYFLNQLSAKPVFPNIFKTWTYFQNQYKPSLTP